MNSSILPIVPPSLLPLTTPFIPPPDCSDIFITTHTVTSYSWNNYTETTLTALYSDPGSEQFTRCQPPGWDKVISKSRFHFSPAVCPDQWTAYNLEAVYVDVPTLTKRATTAFCCASGYTPQGPALNLPDLNTDMLACVSVVGVEPSTSKTLPSTVSASPTPPFPSGIKIHNGYQISWDATDKPTLSPTPPDFKYECSATLDVWIPGSSVGSLECRNKVSDGFGNSHLFIFLIAGIPIIVAALIALCCGVHFRNRRVRRKEEQARLNGPSRGPPNLVGTQAGVLLGDVKQ